MSKQKPKTISIPYIDVLSKCQKSRTSDHYCGYTTLNVVGKCPQKFNWAQGGGQPSGLRIGGSVSATGIQIRQLSSTFEYTKYLSAGDHPQHANVITLQLSVRHNIRFTTTKPEGG